MPTAQGFAEAADASDGYEHFEVEVDPGQSPLRIDLFLARRLGKPRTRIQAGIRAGAVTVGGRTVKPSYKVRPGDRIHGVIPQPPPPELLPEDIPLDIVYEDADLLVVNKPAGMVVHPGYANYTGTLANALYFYFQQHGINPDEDHKPALVHRIDKDTSGLLVVPKHLDAHAHLARQFFEHSIERQYWAVVWGVPEPREGTVSGALARDTRDRRRMRVYADRGKHAVTHYRVRASFGAASLVECRLETGRTHQIRAHMRHLGHPLVGDALYGGDRPPPAVAPHPYVDLLRRFARQALHARVLAFDHPRTGRRLRFQQPLPEDMHRLLQALGCADV